MSTAEQPQSTPAGDDAATARGVYPLARTGTPGEPGTGVAAPSFPEIEAGVLRHWEAGDVFRRSVENRDAGEDGSNEYVFFDGPPFANGLPHYGHLLTGYVKDVVPRYRTMRGQRVERRFGWDTHGLPAELEAMRQLGITTKDEILDLGIDRFNAACRESVLRYTDEWQDYVHRMGRWVDFENDYKTLNPGYMESVIWAFKQLYDRGLAYQDFRVLPYCWKDQTPLSNHELRMDDDVYQMRQDPAVTVGLRLETGEIALVWTTTPWTLPSNLAIMVGPEIDYVVVESDPATDPTGSSQRYLLAEARLEAYARELGEDPASRIVERLKGSEVAGRSYTPPFSYYAGAENAHRVVEAEFVTTTDGTGLVHTAGAFGEEDKVVTDRENIEPVMPVGPDGAFTTPVDEYAGMQVFEANAPIVADLKAATRGETAGSVSPGTVLLRHETYDHSYPHCWRCRTPLIYKGVESWFVKVTEIKDRMLANNEQITWVPENVKHGQFGKWLEGARDWSITRNRFWGSPVPVWVSDDPAHPRVDVYGSLAELEADFGELPRNDSGEVDLHRPWIDRLTRPNPDDPTGRSTMRRVEDVLDVWFDSGSMSYAQNHVPFENAEWFEHHFPADFIVEYIGQTRGWFYTMHVLATALFDRPAFSNVICHGIVLGSDGQKMSKSLRNYPDVSEVFDRDGADAMRWFLMSSSILRGGNLVVTEQGIREGVRQVMIPLWNAWSFFAMYANAAAEGGHRARWSTASADPMDRYVLGATGDLVRAMTEAMDENDIARACEELRDFLDTLTNWYVRRSRDRFWEGTDTAAFDTLFTVLETVARLAAPLLPFAAEEIWRGLTGGESVHLADWPTAEDFPSDASLAASMEAARRVTSAGSALRKGAGLRNRLPLQSLTVVLEDPTVLRDTGALVADELNVREVRLLALESDEAREYGVEQRLVVNARAAGPRLGKDVQTVIKGSKSGDWSVAEDGTVTAGGIELVEGEYTLETVTGDTAEGTATGILPGGGFVVLDTTVTDELAVEGTARDIVRAVQGERRAAGLEVSDRISLTLLGDEQVWGAAVTHQQLIMDEVLAVQFGAGPRDTPVPEGAFEHVAEVDLGEGRSVLVHLSRQEGGR
ncbi:Isoleucyl-tRNA synthetase [Kytococcus aerolatus]|uniref:Isoleucine--tRNA ligase n=1 Tax=Kytococcus aerolatus TaxID=592308 RepID=A0A212U095_9MICO|nr:isoleucine--tRNA ligase [Kytococcus aerolatus]SNC71675.1 Isoleucyl-tRNA synthetase [Kytococcus aerolatus]